MSNSPLNEYSAFSITKIEPSSASWFKERDYIGWYRPEITMYAREHSCNEVGAISFFSVQKDDGLVFECIARWGKAPCAIKISSGSHASTLLALEKLIEILKTIPRNISRNWGLELGRKLSYRSMRPPTFVNNAGIGMPKIVCTLMWGSGTGLCQIESPESLTRSEAFDAAVRLALAAGEASKNPTIAIKKHAVDWEEIVCEAVSPVLSKNQIKVSFFLPKPKLTEVKANTSCYVCKIRWGYALENIVSSAECRSEIRAFKNALHFLGIELAKSKKERENEGDGNKSNPVVAKKQFDSLMINSVELFNVAKNRWSIERAWLMRRKISTHREIIRLHQLSTFFVLLDPLRCLEVEKFNRAAALKNFSNDLKKIAWSTTEKGREVTRASHLRALYGKKMVDVGCIAHVNDSFASAMNSTGFSVELAIDELVQKRLLRRENNAVLALSTVGANLLERELSGDFAAGTIGGQLPTELLSMLVELKEKLAV